jgi:hypothetical protein
VDDGVQALERVAERVVVADVAHDELGVHARQVRLVAGGQVVEHADPVAARDQAPHQRRADESGAAGDQDAVSTTHKTGSLAGSTRRCGPGRPRDSAGAAGRPPRVRHGR